MCFASQKLWPGDGGQCMGRPRKAPEERRGNGPNPRFTTAEKVEIAQHAAILGVSPSDFIRRRSLSYRLPVALAVQRHVAACAVALLRLGVNLNQIARRMNAGRGAPPELLALIARIDALLDQIYGPGDNGGRAQL
jgi:hypothetical protein